MLVLKRKRSQRVLIGRDIILTIVGTSKNGVRLGIEAPEDMVVLRDELVQDVGAGAVEHVGENRTRPTCRSDVATGKGRKSA